MGPTPTTSYTDVGPEKKWFEYLAQGDFMIQRCGACDAHVFYPRLFCTHCSSRTLHWMAPSGQGTVYATTVVRRSLEEGGDYNIALIDLAEGPRMMSRVVGLAPDAIKIGLKVSARIEREGEQNLVVWQLHEGSVP
ncbi:COG1545 Predicted nucleic-acid-binding protein containing a Zn-ribbon [Burkholderiaceae bacterium]